MLKKHLKQARIDPNKKLFVKWGKKISILAGGVSAIFAVSYIALFIANKILEPLDTDPVSHDF